MKEKFDKIEDKIDKILDIVMELRINDVKQNQTIYGNGHPGLIDIVAEHSQKLEGHNYIIKNIKYLWGIVIGIIVSIVPNYLKKIIGGE
jgi:tetrahydromethanopterin S-methyltransferase subunit G